MSNVHGYSALNIASEKGHNECIALLLQHCANVNHIENKYRYTSLYLACVDGYDKCVNILLQHGADYNLPVLI